MKALATTCSACSGRRIVVCAECEGTGVAGLPLADDTGRVDADQVLHAMRAELDRMARTEDECTALIADYFNLPTEVPALGVLSTRALVRSLSPEARRHLRGHLDDVGAADEGNELAIG